MPENIVIREYDEGDLLPVHKLIYKTIDACYIGVYPPRAVEYFKEFHSLEQIDERNTRGQIIIIEKSGAILATGSIVEGDIFAVFVDPESQGNGYGSVLMHELESRAKKMSIRKIELSVSLPSRKFYEKLNYAITDELSIDVGEGQQLRYWKATKQLIE